MEKLLEGSKKSSNSSRGNRGSSCSNSFDCRSRYCCFSYGRNGTSAVAVTAATTLATVAVAAGVVATVGSGLEILADGNEPYQRKTPARRKRCKSRKEAYERAKRAGGGREPRHDPSGHEDDKRPHYHPDVDRPHCHDHYFYPRAKLIILETIFV